MLMMSNAWYQKMMSQTTVMWWIVACIWSNQNCVQCWIYCLLDPQYITISLFKPSHTFFRIDPHDVQTVSDDLQSSHDLFSNRIIRSVGSSHNILNCRTIFQIVANDPHDVQIVSYDLHTVANIVTRSFKSYHTIFWIVPYNLLNRRTIFQIVANDFFNTICAVMIL